MMDVSKLEAGPELDALVAEKVMGLNVLGSANVHRDPECCCGQHWMIPFDYYADVAGHGVDERLVFLADCMCEFRDDGDVGYFGHTSGCLEVVLPYSTVNAAAWKVIEKLQYNWTLSRDVGQCGDDYETSGDGVYRFVYSAPGMPMEGIVAPTAPLAVCRAVVKAEQVGG